MFRTGGGTWAYEYHLKDHLGNLRVAFQDIHGNGSPEVVQRNSYYPFGKSIDALDFSGVGPAYNYQYNGKEKQTFAGLGWYDYGARFYDPVLARWHSVDPKAYKFSSYSSYHYGYLNPIRVIDFEGEENVVVVGAQDKGATPNSDQTTFASKGKGRRHFLEAGLQAAKHLKKERTQNGEGTTMVVMRGDYSDRELEKYEERAQKEGIGFKVIESGEEAPEYINNKNGADDIRANDQITDFHYYGHGDDKSLWV